MEYSRDKERQRATKRKIFVFLVLKENTISASLATILVVHKLINEVKIKQNSSETNIRVPLLYEMKVHIQESPENPRNKNKAILS